MPSVMQPITLDISDVLSAFPGFRVAFLVEGTEID